MAYCPTPCKTLFLGQFIERHMALNLVVIAKSPYNSLIQYKVISIVLNVQMFLKVFFIFSRKNYLAVWTELAIFVMCKSYLFFWIGGVRAPVFNLKIKTNEKDTHKQ